MLVLSCVQIAPPRPDSDPIIPLYLQLWGMERDTVMW